MLSLCESCERSVATGPATRYRRHSVRTAARPSLGLMDNDQRSTPPGSGDRIGDTAEIPWARTTTMPATVPPTVPSAHPQVPPSGSAPAVAPPVWSGKKTAIAAALAIGFASVGAIGAAAALPAGSAQTDQGGRGFPAASSSPAAASSLRASSGSRTSRTSRTSSASRASPAGSRTSSASRDSPAGRPLASPRTTTETWAGTTTGRRRHERACGGGGLPAVGAAATARGIRHSRNGARFGAGLRLLGAPAGVAAPAGRRLRGRSRLSRAPPAPGRPRRAWVGPRRRRSGRRAAGPPPRRCVSRPAGSP